MDNWLSEHTHNETISILQFISELANVNQVSILQFMLEKLGTLVPVDYMIGGTYDPKASCISYPITVNLKDSVVNQYNKELISMDPMILNMQKETRVEWRLDKCTKYLVNASILIEYLFKEKMLGGIFYNTNTATYVNKRYYFSFIGLDLIATCDHKNTMDLLFFCIQAAYSKSLDSQKKSRFRLSTREIEVLKWVKEGKTNIDISQKLNITERTVRYHLSNIFKKFRVNNRTGAIGVAIVNNLID